MLARINLKEDLHKTNTTDRFGTTENQLLNLAADFEDFKEWNIKRMKRMKIER